MYPDPHYDEDDDCQCPDHEAMRQAREDEEPLARQLLRSVLAPSRPRKVSERSWEDAPRT